MDRREFLTSSGLQVETLEVWLEQRWLIPRGSADGLLFSELDVARAHLIRDLRDDLGANDAGIDVILHLMDQLHGLRHAMAQVREQMGEPSSSRGSL